MMRQRQRKTIEELYGGKFDISKSQVTPAYAINGHKIGHATERDYGYIIRSNTPFTGAVPPSTATANNSTATKSLNAGKETSRRKSARPSNKLPNEKYCGREINIMNDGRRSPIQAAKGEKVSLVAPLNANNFDNKTYGNYKDIPAADVSQHHQHQHQNHVQHNHQNHHHRTYDEDKDDTDEFFELIRRTVESAIGKSISELLNRNFKELSSKVDRFSAELKNTNAQLNQFQNDLSNKIVHYGEENSRHFRYLCMKSEYDKMFYQHQTLIANGTSPTTTATTSKTKKPENRKSTPKVSKSTPKIETNEGGDKASTSCPRRSVKCRKPLAHELNKNHQKTSSEDISQKSSEVGMREVLEHIQKFCTQMQMNDLKSEQINEEGSHQNHNTICPEELVEINKEIFAENDDEADEEDDDEWEMSSDDMTPRNKEKNSRNYGGTTTRGCVSQRGNNGAGDG